MSDSEQGPQKTWRPDTSHPDPPVQKEEKEGKEVIWEPDFGPNRGTTDPTSEASSQAVPNWRPDFLSPTTGSNNRGTKKPTESSTSSSENAQGPTSTNAGSNNASSSNAGSTNSSTTPATANPNSTSANGSNISNSNGASNDAKPANGTGNATGGGSSTGSPSGASTTQPGSDQPTTGGAQPAPQPGTTVEKPMGGQPSSGGTTTNADPWNASSGKVDDKGLVQSPARGGTGGTPFSDASFVSSLQTASITAVKIQYKTGIDRIQICHGGKWAEAHGGSAGLQGLFEETFYLQRGEAIVQIEGRSGTKLDSVQFTTSTGRKSKMYGGTGGYLFSWSGKKLVYISGRSGDQVDSLQSYWVA